jgi:site-specific DNA-methyltransferase (adenine-specific)
MVNLHLGDCMEAMAKMPDNAYDLAIVDPPYGIGESSKNFASRSVLGNSNKYTVKDWDKSAPDITYFNEVRRVSKNQIVWGANHFISKLPIDSSCWLVWDKDNGETDFADCELAWTSFKTAVRRFKWTWAGMRQQNMKHKEERIHPTQKPVTLYKWILHNYAKEGDRILDTHGGSMSIAIACHDMGFDLDLWELDAEYYAKGVERFNRHKAQLKLF